MKRCLLGFFLCLLVAPLAGQATNLSFARRPPAQSMLQADSDPVPVTDEPATHEDSADAAPQKTPDVSSYVTVDDENTSKASPAKPAKHATKPSEKPKAYHPSHSRWQAVQYQGSQQDDTFVVTDPAPSMMMGQLSDLQQKLDDLNDRQSKSESSQSDKVSELGIQVMQLKKAMLAMNRVIKELAKHQDASAPQPQGLAGLSVLQLFWGVLSILIVLLLIGSWFWWKQSKGDSTSQAAASLGVARAYIHLGQYELAKQLLKQVLKEGSEKERAVAATLMAECL